jgi:hypothetical protein
MLPASQIGGELVEEYDGRAGAGFLEVELYAVILCIRHWVPAFP